MQTNTAIKRTKPARRSPRCVCEAEFAAGEQLVRRARRNQTPRPLSSVISPIVRHLTKAMV